MTDQTISEEAVEAAAVVLHAELNPPSRAKGSCLRCQHDAERMLTAAYPHLRQQIAEECRSAIIGLYSDDSYPPPRGTKHDDEELDEYDEAVADAELIVSAIRDGVPWKLPPARGAAQSGGEQ